MYAEMAASAPGWHSQLGEGQLWRGAMSAAPNDAAAAVLSWPLAVLVIAALSDDQGRRDGGWRG